MTRIRLNKDEIRYMTLFESLTGATVKDCVQDDNMMCFLIKEGDMGLAIGKGGANIGRVRNAIGKSIFVIEFADDAKNFIKNLFQPVKVKNIRLNKTSNEKIATIEIARQDRRKIMGPNGNKINIAKQLAKRHFTIDNIQVQVVQNG